jgi:hypothetical protein
MSSNELDEALRENLRLRQELAANVVKADAATQRDGSAAYRMGWVVHWTCLALALVAALVSVAAYTSPDQSNDQFLGAAVTAFVLYGLGRAFRYVLSGQ